MDGFAGKAYRKGMIPARPRRACLRRAAIGLVAAYALALQALLSAFAPVAAVASGALPGVLCSGAAVLSGEPAPAAPGSSSHDCAACVMPGCGAAPLPAAAGALLVGPLPPAAAPIPSEAGLTFAAAVRRPQNPRAPPAA